MKKNWWVLVLALVVGSFAWAESEAECERDCDTVVGKQCLEGCKREVKKVNPAVVKFCKPKCDEVTASCKKDCKDEASGKKKHDDDE